MLMVGVALLAGSAVLVAMATGLIALPASGVAKRVRDLVPQASGTGVRSRLSGGGAGQGFVSRLTPPAMANRIDRNLVLAGRPEAWTLRKALMAKPLCTAVAIFVASIMVAGSPSRLIIVFAFGMVALAYFVPDLLIYNYATKRQAEIQKALPDVLDQIVISIEAGVGFEQALAKVTTSNEGPLIDEIVRLIQDISLGMSRRDAYTALAERTSVAELKGFAKSIVQAEEYGISIASVVRSQAAEMRLSRKLRAEARAQQVPVKILIPLMLCILPVLFVIVLGPAVVSAYVKN